MTTTPTGQPESMVDAVAFALTEQPQTYEQIIEAVSEMIGKAVTFRQVSKAMAHAVRRGCARRLPTVHANTPRLYAEPDDALSERRFRGVPKRALQRIRRESDEAMRRFVPEPNRDRGRPMGSGETLPADLVAW